MSNLHKDIGADGASAPEPRGVITCPSCRARWRLSGTIKATAMCRCSRCSEVFDPTRPARAYRLRTLTTSAAVAASGPPRAVTVTAHIGASTQGGLRVGMDDPSLAARVARSSLSERTADGPTAWSWTVVAGEDTGREATPPAGESSDTAAAPAQSARPPAAAVPDVPEGPASLRESPLPASTSADTPGVQATVESAAGGAPSVGQAVVSAADVPEFGSADWAEEPERQAVEAVADVPVEVARRPTRSSERRAPAIVGFLGVLVLAAGGAVAGGWASERLAATMTSWTRMWPATSEWVVPTDPVFWAAPGAATGLLVAWMWVRWMQRER